MVDLMDEVAEEVRQEALVKKLKRYGPFVVFFSIGILILTAIYIGWKNYSIDQIKKVSEVYYEATQLPSPQKKKRLAAFEALSLQNKEGYGVLSRFQVAQLQKTMEPSKVSDVFANIVSKTNSPKVIKNAAKMMEVLNDLDFLTDKKAQKLLEDLQQIENQAPAWSFLSKFLQAHLLFYLKMPQEGKDILLLLTSTPEVPEELSSLAKAYLNAYTSGTLN